MNISIMKGHSKNKPFKVKTVVFQRIGRVILWTLIIFLILRGIGTLFNKSEVDEAEKIINDFVLGASYKEEVEREAASFAERFAREYFTFDRNDIDGYDKRIKNFVSSYVPIEGRNYGNGRTQVLDSSTYKVDWFRKNQVNVYVSVKLQYEQEIKNEEEVTREIKENEVHVLVPVMEKDGRYVVEDLPAVIPNPKKAEISPAHFSGTVLDADKQKEIQEVLGSFFKTYYSGNSGEISYYMHENQSVQGLEGKFVLSRIEPIKAFEGKTVGEYFAIVNLTIEDSLSKLQFNQNFNINLVQKDGRYYIKDFNVRSVNLNENEGEI